MRLAVSNISYPLNDIKTECVYTCIYIQCNTSPKFLFNYNKQTKPKDFENIIHKVPVYRYSGPSLQITFDQIRNWTGTQQRFSRGGPKKIGWTSWLETLFFNGKGKKEAPFFPLKGGGVSFSPSWYVHAEYKYKYK